MKTSFQKIAPKTISILILLLTAVLFINAQENVNESNKPSSEMAKNDLNSFEDIYKKLLNSRKNPVDYAVYLAELLNKFPNEWQTESSIYSLRDALKSATPQETKRIIENLLASTKKINPDLKMNLYLRSSRILTGKNLYAEAAELSQKTIDLLNEAEYMTFQKSKHEYSITAGLKKDPKYKPRPFDLSRTKIEFINLQTGSYNNLGKSLWAAGKSEQAEKVFRTSFDIRKTNESALGIARSAEKNGKLDEALKYAAAAALTGRLEPAEMDYFLSLYAKLHQGKTDGADEYLDEEFRKTYRNPVQIEKYKKTDQRSDRVVLAEFITGAGCIPCIPFDYTFEKVLENYTSKEVSLLVFHWHAPTMDPLGNHSSDSRVKYYDVKGAPTLFIDGKRFGQDGNYNGTKDEEKDILLIAGNVVAELNTGLEIPADANIKLKAVRNGQNIAIKVSADKFKNISDDVTLHLALVEKEVSYSGENGLRFQFMVVRALAGDNDKREFGFKIDKSSANKFDYTFDVNKIAAQNLAYYDTHTAERTKEFLERVGAKSIDDYGINFNFKYKKNEINANNLAIVAYLQDNKTKKILQSASVNLGK